MRWYWPFRATPTDSPNERYAVRSEEDGIRWFTARGEQPQLTAVLLELVRGLPAHVGLAMIETDGAAREWFAPDLPRHEVLHALLSTRDLLGAGGLDLAVYSSERGVEIYLDSTATLEVRTGSWEGPRVRGVLETAGFKEVPRIPQAPPVHSLVPAAEVGARLDRIRIALGLPDEVSDAGGAAGDRG